MDYTTRELTKEEGDALTKDMQEVLEKHEAEMSVVSTIQLLKRIPNETTGTKEETTEAKQETA